MIYIDEAAEFRAAFCLDNRELKDERCLKMKTAQMREDGRLIPPTLLDQRQMLWQTDTAHIVMRNHVGPRLYSER